MFENNFLCSRTLDIIPLVTRQCNFRCIYCYEEHKNLRMKQKQYNSIVKWIQNSIENRLYNKVNVNFFGGEPLLEYNNIIKFLYKLYTLRQKYSDVMFGFSMTTNGYLLTPEKFVELHKLGIRNYQITIDGTQDKHDRTRPLANNKGSWRQIIDNLVAASKTDLDFHIIIRTNYNYDSLDDQHEFFEFIAKAFDNRFSVYFEPIKKLGGKNDCDLIVVNDIEQVAATTYLLRDAIKLGLRNDTYESFISPCGKVCYAANPNSFVVDYDGTLKKCTLVIDDDRNNIGTLNEDGTINIDFKKHARWVSDGYISGKSCIECKLLPICMGKRCPKAYVIDNIAELDCTYEELQIMQWISCFGR